MTVIATSTAATATAYSNQRKVDRCQNGVLWSMFWDGTATTTTSMDFYYSTDDGATWTKGAEFGFAGTGTTYVPNASLFIDLDDYAHVAYKDSHDGKVYYRRGTPNAARTEWTWSAATALWGNNSYNTPDLIVHREGTDWVAHVVMSHSSSTTAAYVKVTITSGGTISAGSLSVLSGTSTSGPLAWPSIDFNHTGDGKTIAGGTPHLYVAWSAGETGAGKGIRFKKATYSGGTWTWGTEREIDNTLFVNGSSRWLNCLFDGTRVLIGGYMDNAALNQSVVLHERDVADTTTTTRVLAAPDYNYLYFGSLSDDGQGNVYLFGWSATNTVSYRKWDRASGVWEATVVIDSTALADAWITTKRGSSNGLIEFIYTDGTASPYSVTYGQVVAAGGAFVGWGIPIGIS